MKVFKPTQKTMAAILVTPIKEGQFLAAIDSGELFLDISDSERIQLGTPGLNNWKQTDW